MPAPQATPSEAEGGGRSSPIPSWWQLAGVGVAVYALALAATLPAKVALPHAVDTAGTVWRGEAALGGGHVAAWQASLLGSLATGGVAGRWTLDGPGSALQGGARWRPFAGVALDTVHGRAAWPLVALAAPTLPFACDVGLHLSLDKVVLAAKQQAVAGSVTSDPGTCTTRVPGASHAVPRLVADFASDTRSTGVVSPWANRALHLADITIGNGLLHVRTSAAGAALIPGSIAPGDLEIEL